MLGERVDHAGPGAVSQDPSDQAFRKAVGRESGKACARGGGIELSQPCADGVPAVAGLPLKSRQPSQDLVEVLRKYPG